MRRFRYTLIIAVSLLGFSSLNAQQTFVLNEPVMVQKSGNEAAFHFSLNEALFSDPEFKRGAEFIFNTPEGSKELIVRRKSEFVPGYISVIAADKQSGENVFATTYYQGKLNGLYHRSHKEAQQVSFDPSSETHMLTANEHEEGALACGVKSEDAADLITPKSQFSQRSKIKGGGASSAAPLNEGLEDVITIDLMILYTEASANWASTSSFGNIGGVVAQAMNLSQQALDNSETNIELRLVHYYQTPYDETTDNVEDTDERLNRLTQNDEDPVFDGTQYNGYMEEVHNLRDQYGADVVAMFALIEDTGGLGWILGGSGGNAYRAFNINRVQQVARDYTLIHEIGHNMGNDHSRTQLKAQASGGGGLFQYSVGYQNESAGFHTVMAYDETQNGTRLDEIPYFSSPNIMYQGTPTGTSNNITPENSALSMSQIKRAISYYRPSQVDAPVADASADQISITMNREDNITIPVTVSNTGSSPLVWYVDFAFAGNSVNKNKINSLKKRGSFQPVELAEMIRTPANYSGSFSSKRSKVNEEIIYSTSFESSEGFVASSFSGVNEWRALSDTEFEVSNENSKTGNQHLRLSYDSGDTQFIASPFFGYQTLGTYEVTINFSISDPSDEVYDFYLFDGRTGGYTSGVIIASGSIYYFDTDENGGVTNLGGTETILANQYYNLRIVYNVENESIDYYLNGVLEYEAGYMQGYTPGVIQVLNRNNATGSYMDVDDIEIKKVSAPYSWLNLPEMTGVVEAGQSKDINLAFTTEGVSAGEYNTILTVRTNEPGNEVIEVPITLTVNQAVSNEQEDQPQSIALEQNYPNPFNPVTTIRYSLDQVQSVQLDVFNMQGQKVATIIQGEKISAGEHSVQFDATSLASGIYMYRLRSGSQTVTRQMVLIK